MARELTNAQITHVSLVNKGANGKKFAIMKSDKQPDFNKEVKIVKSNEEQQLVTGVVYEPDVLDAHEDYMTATEIEKAAHQFLSDYRNIDKQHDFASSVGEVVESWIAKTDMKLGDDDITAGTWVMTVKVSDADSLESIKNGDVTGFSMVGLAETIEKSEDASSTIDKTEKGLMQVIKNFFLGEPIQKGIVRENYKRNQKSRNLWAAWDALDSEYYDSRWENRTADVTDFARLKEAATDFLELVSEIETQADVQKALNEKPNKEEDDLKPEDITAAVEKAVKPLNDRIDAFEKQQEQEGPNEPEGGDDNPNEELADTVMKAVEKAIEPVSERLTKLEKARGISKQDDTDGDGQQEQIKKSVWDNLL
ncbi:XkdF-like putative serine protease domain-containing protein [Alkalicoccobacillus plakortidis]|uniref:XkdF-like putative serine protease domain-containing protein n=1 Tax=Alkalicoccobacillus plakortidis TaxID=444060 RepID=A0ABT0XDW0_9BACI|nr:XkdF-like putative serine protease domain-containing protein [Alkalicoccobacillus plakortidis]MCM2674086.1 XkdF-like putative serine protease domain-containing protein [Alkalicoccobacillus plakortidis]